MMLLKNLKSLEIRGFLSFLVVEQGSSTHNFMLRPLGHQSSLEKAMLHLFL